MADDHLHRNPSLYEKMFERSAEDVCLELFEKHLPELPSSVLDIGCGTGRDLHRLSSHCGGCVGIDAEPKMIEFAAETYPEVTFHVGDMRDLRLEREFDAITVLGSALNYMLTNGDLERAIETFRIHAHSGTLLVIEPFNTASFVAQTKLPTNYDIVTDELEAHGKASYRWDAPTQTLHRRRVWSLDHGAAEVVDRFTLRLLFSQELVSFLEAGGFEIVEIFERQRSQVYAKTMYIVAKRS